MAPNLTITPMKDLKIYYTAMVSDMKILIVCKTQASFESYWRYWLNQYTDIMVNSTNSIEKEDISSMLVWLYGVYKKSPDSKMIQVDDFYFGPKSFKCEVKFPPHKIFRCSFKMKEECIIRDVPQCGVRNELGVLQCTIEMTGSIRMISIEGSDARALFSKNPMVMLGEAYHAPRKFLLEGESSKLKSKADSN